MADNSGEHQLRALSLSAAVTDRLTDNVRQEPARTMFGEDTSIYRQSREQVVEVLTRWSKDGNNQENGKLSCKISSCKMSKVQLDSWMTMELRSFQTEHPSRPKQEVLAL